MVRIVFMLLFAASLSAAELSWADSYAEAVKQAKVENKNVLVLISKERCRWCKKLKTTTLQDETVVARLERSYVIVEVVRDVDDYPEYLKAKMVPMSYFLYPDGSMIMRGVAGYWSVEDYMSFLDDVDYKIKKHRRQAAEKAKLKS